MRCDFCKNTATKTYRTATNTLLYVCDKHAETMGKHGGELLPIVETPTIVATCSLCGEIKPIDDFYKYTDARGVKRRRSECKACNLQERKIRRLKKK